MRAVLVLLALALALSACGAAERPAFALTADLVTPTDIGLSWRGVPPDAAATVVEFATEPSGQYTILEFLPPDRTGFEHPDLMPETTFYYRVRPVHGPTSNEVEVRMPAAPAGPNAPGVPTAPAARAVPAIPVVPTQEGMVPAAPVAPVPPALPVVPTALAEPGTPVAPNPWVVSDARGAPHATEVPGAPNASAGPPHGDGSVRRVGADARARPDGLGAPTNLTASVVAPDGVRFGWTDNAATEVGFLLESRPVGGREFRVVAALDPEVDSFELVTLPEERVATYRVRAYRFGASSTVAHRTTGIS